MPKVADLIKNRALTVGVGTKVLIEVNGELQEWEIVDVGEANIPNGKISHEAPLIKAILGARKGEVISCKVMDSDIRVIVRDVSSSLTT